MKINPLIRPYIELDLYGSDEETAVTGEDKTRLALRHVKLIKRKLEIIKTREPELLRGRVVKIFYAMWPHPEAVDEFRVCEIWLNTPNTELTPLTQVQGLWISKPPNALSSYPYISMMEIF